MNCQSRQSFVDVGIHPCVVAAPLELCHGGFVECESDTRRQTYRPCGRRSSKEDSDLPRGAITTTLPGPVRVAGLGGFCGNETTPHR